MDRLKTFSKYIIWIVLFYVFSCICTYVGFNATYKNIENIENIPEQVNIELAQATSVNGRIYGKISKINQNGVNGKFIKVQIYDRNNNLAGTKYLKIENLENEGEKKFAVYFTANNIKRYTVEIISDSEKTQEEIIAANELFKDIFTNKQLSTYVVVALVLGLIVL